MRKEGYTPYCGNSKNCDGGMPRTVFDGSQFYCFSCQWRSSFKKEFIEKYKEKWKYDERVKEARKRKNYEQE